MEGCRKRIRRFEPQSRAKKKDHLTTVSFLGWDGGIRTPECWYQKPVPYHLATSQCVPTNCTLTGVNAQVDEVKLFCVS